MGKLFSAARSSFDESESLRMAVLSGVSFALGLAFVALLIADEAHAAGL